MKVVPTIQPCTNSQSSKICSLSSSRATTKETTHLKKIPCSRANYPNFPSAKRRLFSWWTSFWFRGFQTTLVAGNSKSYCKKASTTCNRWMDRCWLASNPSTTATGASSWIRTLEPKRQAAWWTPSRSKKCADLLIRMMSRKRPKTEATLHESIMMLTRAMTICWTILSIYHSITTCQETEKTMANFTKPWSRTIQHLVTLTRPMTRSTTY